MIKNLVARMAFYNCDCFITQNIYVQELNRHFKFIDTNQFFKDYGEILSKLGYNTNTEKNSLLKEITEEINRRKNLEKHSLERKKLLQQMYKPIETTVFNLQENFFDPSFINLVSAAKSLNFEKTLQLLDVISKEKQLYGFRIFTQEFCNKLIKELDHYRESSLPKGRPNSMNKYGVLLDELGFHDHFSQILRTEYLDPLAKVLFPEWRGNELDSHKIFTVCYKTNEDLELGCHYDNGEVTLNVCLGKSFEGGDLYFGDMRTIPIAEPNYILIQHKVGYGIFHRGQQLHGAFPIMKGERQNLIIWLRASSVRNKLCPMCNSKPTLSPSVGYGDGFTLNEEN